MYHRLYHVVCMYHPVLKYPGFWAHLAVGRIPITTKYSFPGRISAVDAFRGGGGSEMLIDVHNSGWINDNISEYGVKMVGVKLAV